MKGKFPAKAPLTVSAVLALAGGLSSPAAGADDGNRTQQIYIEQNKSEFQLKLEQIEARARQRAAEAREDAAGERPEPVDLGDSGESLRLELVDPVGPLPAPSAARSARELEAEQAYDRDQMRILDERQRQRELRYDSPVERSDRIGSYGRDRLDDARVRSESRQQTLQRKLRP